MASRCAKALIFVGIFLLSFTSAMADVASPTALAIPARAAAGQAPTTALPTASTPIPNTPIATQPQLTPTAPNINATAYVLMDANSGQVIAAKNIDQRMAPASLTKMMTSYIISTALREGRIHMTDMVTISPEAWQTGGSKMFVKVGTQVAVQDLMQGIIVDSGNDACVAMAEYVAGSQDSFVNLMNQQAALLGMTGTHFMDVNGLPDPQHYTTPRDMATLARALILNFPEDYKWYSQKWFTYNNIKQPNRNRLLWRDPSVDGVKTGHTDEAGFCLVASGIRNNMRLIAVVMGAPTDEARADDSESLLTYGFRFFESHKLYVGGEPLTDVRVWNGENKIVSAGVARDLYVTIPTGQYNRMKTALALNGAVHAPIEQGQALGSVRVILGNSVLTTEPLVALQADPEGSLWRRLMDKLAKLL